jgi:hypothetical protein
MSRFARESKSIRAIWGTKRFEMLTHIGLGNLKGRGYFEYLGIGGKNSKIDLREIEYEVCGLDLMSSDVFLKTL